MRVPGGYIDLQINGGWGHHFSDDPGAIWAVGARLAEHGVTGFLPTLVSDGFDRLAEALEVLNDGPPHGWRGAAPLGWHIEGPFLDPAHAGAHRPSAIRPIAGAALDLLRRDRGVRLITLAPELDGADSAIDRLRTAGVAVSLGHTGASAAQARGAVNAGVTMGTHLFNAMQGLHHRSPGAAHTLLTDPRVAVGLIADGQHVAPEMIDLAWRLAGDRIVAVSDAVSMLGQSDEAAARLSDGTLAGSTIAIDQCVRNLVAFTGCSLAQATLAASSRPAAVIDHQPSHDDWVELDEHGHVSMTSIGGSLFPGHDRSEAGSADRSGPR